MTDARIPKSSILRACLIKQELTIDDFEKEAAQIKSDITSRDESASQAHKGSSERNELLVRMEGEIVFLKNELMGLQAIDPTKTNKVVEPGAVVVTNQRIFFISTSIEQVEVNGQSVFGISLKAPLYASMKDKKKGESFSFGGVNYKILDLY